MTPLRLELAGFTCFRELVSVDFSELELFAISGATGSGKSTLLDALTYALYGQTARLGSKGLDVLISPGLMQMYVVLEFKNAQGTFKVTRTADRKPSGNVTRNTRIEELQQDAKYKQLAESEKLKDADSKLEQLVGLDYDGFTRSVMLPQGAFDEFLRGDASKRRKLLVNLLGLDKVEQMQKEAGRLSKEAKLQEDNITERLEQDYAGATPEKRAELTESLKGVQKDVKRLSSRQTSLLEELRRLDEVKDLLSDQAKVQNTLLALKDRSNDIKEKKEQLELARKAHYIAPQIEQVQRLEAKLKTSTQTLESITESLNKQRLSLSEAETKFKTAKEAADLRLPELEEKLTSLSAVTPLMSQLKSRGGSLALASQASHDISYSDEAWDANQHKQAQLPNLKQSAQAIEKSKQDLIVAQKSLEGSKQTIAQLELEETQWVERGKEARLAQAEAKKVYDAAVIANQALVLREHLHEGETCPVCEQIVKQIPETKEHELNSLKASLDACDAALEEITTSYRDTKAKAAAEKERLSEKQEACERLGKSQFEQEEQFNQTLKALKVASVTEAEEQIKTQKITLLATLAATISEKTEGINPEEAQAKFKQEKQSLEANLKAAEAAQQNAKSSLDTLETKLELLSKQSEHDRSELGSLVKGLDKALATANFTSANEASAAVLSDLQMKALDTELTSFASQKEAAERRDVELQAKLSGRTLDEAAYLLLKTEQQSVKDELSEAQTALGRLEQELQMVEKQLERAKELQKERAKHRQIFDTFRQLSLDLRGNEFQEFLLSQVQAKLAHRASHILRDVTDGRYNLRLVEGEYQVLDAWNTGDTRNAKTLSGGETFITSLALALALSDTIAGSHALGALFLDEGFGTLDSITLDSVAQVLENLTKEGRMVGVITHVSALTERLPARLSVSKGKEGSTLSWDVA